MFLSVILICTSVQSALSAVERGITHRVVKVSVSVLSDPEVENASRSFREEVCCLVSTCIFI